MSEAPTARTRIRRLPELGVYERERVEAIIDEALFCHLAWIGADGAPRVIPTIHARIDDTLYVHGSAASSTLRAVKAGLPVAIAITLVDGIRFARSMFEHSMNYRTVVVYGAAAEVTDPDELSRLFVAITDQVAPGRSADARPPTPDEIRQTTFVKVSLDEFSAKVSEGFPEEPDADLALDVWAGILPLHQTPGEPLDDPLLRDGTPRPPYVTHWRRPGVVTTIRPAPPGNADGALS
jgi:nitroimidazol reductase NimA-like FMN-containing flavoprotein (pyridoxamine 5'-phosphate oxidase superfamily)